MKITCNAARCYLAECTPEEHKTIKFALQWTDKGIAYNNYRYGTKDSTARYALAKDSSFPTGLLPEVLSVCTSRNYEVDLDLQIPKLDPTNEPLPSWAWDHQKKAVEAALQAHRGLVRSPTGSGKSYMISFLIAQFPTANIIVVAPYINLMENLARTIEKIVSEKVGRVGGSKKDWRRITVGVAKTVNLAITNNPKALKDCDILIFDECHHAGASTYCEISDACTNTAYRWGFSATLNRKDGAEILMRGNIGPTLMEIKEDSLTTQSVIHTPNIIYVDLNTPKMVYSGAIKDKKGNVLGYNTANNKPDLQEVYEKQIVYSKHRNQTIVDLLSVYLANPHYKGLALIIVQRIEHGNTIKTLCENKDIPAVFLHGSSKNRLATLDQFRSGAFRVLIGSTILQEGEDVPKLELAIIAAGGSNLTNTIQRIGRALRIDPSGVKTKPIIVDFIDNEENFLLNNSIARKSYSSSIFPDSIQHLTYEQTKTFLSQPPA